MSTDNVIQFPENKQRFDGYCQRCSAAVTILVSEMPDRCPFCRHSPFVLLSIKDWFIDFEGKSK